MKFSNFITCDIIATLCAPVDQHGVSGSAASAILPSPASTSSLAGNKRSAQSSDDEDDSPSSEEDGDYGLSVVEKYLLGIGIGSTQLLSTEDPLVTALKTGGSTAAVELNEYEESLRGIRFSPEARTAIMDRAVHTPTKNNICNCNDCNNVRYARHVSTIDYDIEINTQELIQKLGVGEQLRNCPECIKIINEWESDVYNSRKKVNDKKKSDNDESAGEEDSDDRLSDDEEEGGNQPDDQPWYQPILGTEFDPSNIDPRIAIMAVGSGNLGVVGGTKGLGQFYHNNDASVYFLMQKLRIADTWRNNSVDQRGEQIVKMIAEMRKNGYQILNIKKVGGRVLYQVPPPVFVKLSKKCNKDSGSLRTRIYDQIDKNLVDKAERMLSKLEQHQQKEINNFELMNAIMTNTNNLGSINPFWVPSCQESCDRKDISKDYNYNSRAADVEMQEAIDHQRAIDEKKNERKKSENIHVSTQEAFLSNLVVFEALLDGTACTNWAELNKITEGKAAMLLRIKEEDWDSRPRWQKMQLLACLAYQIVKKESKQCYYCFHRPYSRGADGHLDHLEIYNKRPNINPCQLKSVRELLLEGFCTKYVCASDHRHGAKHDKVYDARLMTPCQLVYGPKFGTNHRTVSEVLDLQEVQLFVLEGKKVGGFVNGDASLADLKVILWNIFGIHYLDVLPCTEKYYNRQGDKKFQQSRVRVWNKVFTRVLIKLSGKCRMCGKCFLNMHPMRRGGVELNHLNERAKNPGLMKFQEAEKLLIDTYIDQLRKGNADAVCVYCHDAHFTNPGTINLWNV